MSNKNSNPSSTSALIQSTMMDYVENTTNQGEDGKYKFQTVKKRKASDSPEQNEAKTKTVPTCRKDKKNQPVLNKNRYSILPVDEVVDATPSLQTDNPQVAVSQPPSTLPKKEPSPPPIFVKDVTDFSKMVKCITDAVKPTSFTTKALASCTVKVQVNNTEEYRKLVRHFKQVGVYFYTYQLKMEKPFKVVIRNLHHSIGTEEITEALHEAGHTVRNVANIKHWKTKEPLSLFFVDLEPADNNAKIYDLTSLLHMRIKVESPKPKRTEVQCKRCQAFGHTQAYCTLPYSCVKCGGEHDNRNCQKKPEEKPRCANCSGEHPANYRGCPEFRKKITQTRRIPTVLPNPAPQTPVPRKPPTRGTYAEAAADKTHLKVADTSHTPVPHTQQANNPQIEMLLEKLIQQQEESRQQTVKLIDLLTTLVTKLLK